MTESTPLRVLVTGAAGAIGQAVSAGLTARGDYVRAFDRVTPEPAAEVMLGDLTDAAAVRRAVAGMDAIVHLAAFPNDAPFPELLGPNVLGLFHVLDAAREEGVRRVVLASTLQVGGKVAGQATAQDRNPSNHYALTKLLAEEMGAMYVRRFGMNVIAARFGWMVRNEREAQRLPELGLFHAYLSRRDATEFCHCAVHAPFQGFAVLYVMSRGGFEHYDLETPRRLIGYEPRDTWPHGLPFPVPELETARES